MRQALGSLSLQRAFTLTEMLVTLVIVAMLATMLGQAMFQVARIEERLQASGTDSQRQMVRREWVRSLIESSLLDQTEQGPAFRGDDRTLDFASAEAMAMAGVQNGMLHLELRADEAGGQASLRVTPSLPLEFGTKAPEAPPLLAWSGKAGAIRYLDAKGDWHARWPVPNSLAQDQLPRAVLIDLHADIGGPLLVAISNGETQRLKLRDWERQ